MSDTADRRRTNTPGYLLGGLLIAWLLALMIATLYAGGPMSRMQRGSGAILLGVYLQSWGIMFLAAYFWAHTPFFLRGLMWVCERFSSPAGRGMAFFYFALCFGLGSLAVARGLGW
jgi:hypothetical protein